ncbi:cytidine deaminase [Candidatus Woesearchaeota archaeon]|nr:cytidine deaminase [Candidatus Woesearchaeota archaeon]
MYNDLIQRALDARKNSWSPYSKFKVGAALITNEGKIETGTNVENSSYGLTICAERTAIVCAKKEGYLDPMQGKFIRALVAVLPIDELGKPCGACRQVIKEFAEPGKDVYIVMAKPNGDGKVVKLQELLKYGFGPADLGIQIPSTAGKES